eukprot:TRINITY_DN106800_c0_g1_i1.p2 TRINITY_DN106800_c0_g1~~TRINITY_DN106800_c0_g1_i1.p2  ORF type:complete len:121 (+),score=21.94 TRINITY_DN106800_c0_g1_i1:54-416(+)
MQSARTQKREARRPRVLLLCGIVSSACLASVAFSTLAHPGRRAAVIMAGGWAASSLSGASSVLAAPEINAEQEACLSECVYKCSGGARGKGEEFKGRARCISVCKDECLPKAKEEELEVT